MELSLLIEGVLIITSFCLGLNAGNKKENRKEVAILNPIRTIKEYKQEKEYKQKEEKINHVNEINMLNIDNYNGTDLGQKEVPREE